MNVLRNVTDWWQKRMTKEERAVMYKRLRDAGYRPAGARKYGDFTTARLKRVVFPQKGVDMSNPFRERMVPFTGRRQPKRNPEPTKNGLTKVKTITSHAGLFRWLRETKEVGYLPRQDIPSPYTYSPTHLVYIWNGKQVIVVETSHKHYEVFALPPGMKIYRTDEEATDVYIASLKGKSNPTYTYGPTGFRPPKKWFNMMLTKMKSTYRKYPGQSAESYREALARLAGGAWARMSDAARMGIVRRYEPMAKNPGADYHWGQRQLALQATKTARSKIAKAEAQAVMNAEDKAFLLSEGLGLRNPKGKSLSVPEQHQLKIAYKTLNMPDAILGVIGGMTKAEAREVILRLTGKKPVGNPGAAWHRHEAQMWRQYSDDSKDPTFKKRSDAKAVTHWASMDESKKLNIPNPIGRCPIHGFRIPARGKKVRCPGGHWLTVPGRAR